MVGHGHSTGLGVGTEDHLDFEKGLLADLFQPTNALADPSGTNAVVVASSANSIPEPATPVVPAEVVSTPTKVATTHSGNKTCIMISKVLKNAKKP